MSVNENSGNAQVNENVNGVVDCAKEEKRNRYLKEKKGNMYGFITNTFNAIIGICEHQCGYCYVSKMCPRLKPIRLEEKALEGSLGKDNFIFVGSGTDVFAKNVSSEWIMKVLDYCDKFDNKYLFQSKNPERFSEFIEHPVFKKSVICTTIESNRPYADSKAPSVEKRVSAIEAIKEKTDIDIYVTIEPIMDFDLLEMVDLIKRCSPVQVNIGADSKKTGLLEPSKEKIDVLIVELKKFTIVEEKDNLKRLMKSAETLEMEQAKKAEPTSLAMKVQIMERTNNGYTIKEENRKFGLIRENRPIKDSDIYGFLQIIQNGRYDESHSIITAEASELLEKYNLTDLQGNVIPQEEIAEYLIILDGQHRISAFSKLNLTRTEENQITIPNVHIKSGITNVREYLADINMTGHSWSTADKICVSAISTGNKLLTKINELIKQGYNASTASIICTGDRLKPKDLKALLSKGDISCLSDEKYSQEERLKRAEKFITITMSIQDMSVKTLTKRYFINGFNSFAKAHTDNKAFEALEKLTINDFISISEDDDFVEKLKIALLQETA